MLFLDRSFETPEENLACDEALLELCEAGQAGPVLRFWEPKSTFVVVGYANAVTTEVNVPACEEAGVPILRRCTGGGTVLQLPGCLNYTVVLRIDSHPQLAGIPGTNAYVMERSRAAAECASGETVRLEGHTDLAIGRKKFCGNAQRRRKRFLIFHGCFLLNADLGLIGHFLRMPSKQPEYRAGRQHGEFVRNLSVTAEALKGALKAEWGADGALNTLPGDRIEKLVRERYSRREWNWKF